MQPCSKRDDIVVRLQERQQRKQHNVVPGSRIVWFDGERQAQLGTVLWIGELNGQRGVYAGVNFDNPVGSGANGRFGGRQLFRTKPNHAAFVQTHGLFAEEDYLELTTSEESMAKAVIDKDANEAAIERKGFVVGDRIAWLDLTATPQFGTIRWIGLLDRHNHLFAGIDFDEPLVSLFSPKRYLELKRVFNGIRNRSGFVRIDHIVSEEDYLAERNPFVERAQDHHDEKCVAKAESGQLAASSPKTLAMVVAGEAASCIKTKTEEKAKPEADHKLQRAETDGQPPLSDKEISPNDVATDPIRVGERIEWVDSKGRSNFGAVKWIGCLSGYNHVYGGIEFDEPIGGGTGMHKEEQIFVARNKHALFVPYDQLMRENKADSLDEVKPLQSKGAFDHCGIQDELLRIISEGLMHKCRPVRRPTAIAAAEIPPAYVDFSSEEIAWRVDGDSSSPSLFYLQFFRFGDSLTQLIAEIKPPTVVMDQPSIGSVCIAEFRDNWYRAEVTAVDADSDSVTVLYIDYGNVAVKKLNEVYHITDDQPEIVRKMHRLAVPCKLYGVERFGLERSATAIEDFQLAFPEAECVKINLKTVESGMHVVDVNVTQKELSLIALLISWNAVEETDQMNGNDSNASYSSALQEERDNAPDEGESQYSFELAPITVAIGDLSLHSATDVELELQIQGVSELNGNHGEEQLSQNSVSTDDLPPSPEIISAVGLAVRKECPSRLVAWREDGELSTPSLFFIRFDAFSTIEDTLRTKIERPTIVMDQPIVGSLCIAEFDGAWYRAEVTAVDAESDLVTVRYVDFGNVEVKKWNEVYHITDEQPDDVRNTHVLALACKLDGVEPIESAEWPATAIAEFQTAFLEVMPVTVDLKSWQDGVHLVDVFVDGRSLADSLIAMKVAKASAIIQRNEAMARDSGDMDGKKVALKTAICNALKLKQRNFNIEGKIILRFKPVAQQSPIEPEESSSDSDLSILDMEDDSDSRSDISFVDYD